MTFPRVGSGVKRAFLSSLLGALLCVACGSRSELFPGSVRGSTGGSGGMPPTPACTADFECGESDACAVRQCVDGQCALLQTFCDDGDVCTDNRCDPLLGCVFPGDGVAPLARDPRDTHALHLYVVRIDPGRAGATRDDYQRALEEEQIATSIHFLPVHRLTWFRARYASQQPLPVAERAGEEVLSLPLSPAHSDDDIADAIEAVRRVHARFAS